MKMENIPCDSDLFLTQREAQGSIRKGCDPFAQTQRSKLQHRRARINQQINKEMRMRAGAENLFRATTNHKVRETVALELSYVNSNLQLLKEELEELNSSVEIYQNESDAVSVPMIPLGLKETKDLDVTEALKDFIANHYGEDGSLYDKEIRELMDLRQAMRTPSRSDAGIELLVEYYNQLYFLDNRFFPPNKPLGVFFHWYDSLTGVPSCQRALAFEKGSVLFNMGALYTQIGARQDRLSVQGIDTAIDAFQKAAGCFNYLKENFSNAPSLDMSASSLNMLVRLMVAQVQECVFEKFLLQNPQNDLFTQLQAAQEAAKVEEVYTLVYRTMTQPPVKDYIPFSWSTMVHVKAEHFKALSHYHAACSLCDYSTAGETEVKTQEKAFAQFHVTAPEGPSLAFILQDPEERRKLGKAHLKRAIMKHEEAMRIHGLCKILRKMDILQEVLTLTHRKSLSKYSDIDHEEDFFETGEAPDIQPITCQRPEIKTPVFSKVKVTDIFHRLGPLSVFSAKHKWRPPQKVHLEKGDDGFGFTLRGDAPVLVAGIVPGGCAEHAGVMENSYIVSVSGTDCRWAKHSQVVQQLKNSGEHGVDIELVVFHNPETQITVVDKRASMLTACELLGCNKENSKKSVLGSKSASALRLWSKRSKASKRNQNSNVVHLPFSAVQNSESMY
ncbi:rhophilin-1 isoform X1 [Xenopus laevis]|uniref:Rhophilin-1 isoform X1 n=1 Tax=Xenopus laevis TaxID=8355 RepID=A0A8J1KZ92_XENLA|nr:rhophilin-1 isoform X1 [Xenopus laevis]XP_041422625.1 rhophilin-1 isoform X1 [Xenopus laevis]XP_041422626.1 rhophilin-1 isoform X1 [Xenopus laevis]XP_041422627.1 rhophilin-1 isoform X1 [Xenopus laevis]